MVVIESQTAIQHQVEQNAVNCRANVCCCFFFLFLIELFILAKIQLKIQVLMMTRTSFGRHIGGISWNLLHDLCTSLVQKLCENVHTWKK